MSRRRRRPRALPTPGLPPGTLSVDPEAGPTRIRAFGFSPEGFEELPSADRAALTRLAEKWPIIWVDVEGLGDAAALTMIADHFGLHPLAMEDVVDTSQRAKVEPYGEITFIVMPMPRSGDEFNTEQLSLFLGRQWVVTFQESSPGDCLGGIRDRIRFGRGRVRRSPAAYLAYALIDAVIDGYFPIVEQLGDRLDALEHRVLERPDHRQIVDMRVIKRQLARLRRAIWPMRDAATTMISLDTVFAPELRLFIRDAHDHVVRLMDIVETDRAMASDLIEIHLSAISARQSEVNKFLTIIATIFLPLSWIAGIYGMNFEFMPELHWAFGYPMALLMMAAFAAGLLIYFYRKGWLAPSGFGSLKEERHADGPRGAPPKEASALGAPTGGDRPSPPQHPVRDAPRNAPLE